MDAAARPFPRDETTPPVTKMYLTGLLSLSLFCMVYSAERHPVQQPSDACQVGRRVHAVRVARRLDRLHVHPVAERPQLFQRLGPLEHGRLERREGEKGF